MSTASTERGPGNRAYGYLLGVLWLLPALLVVAGALLLPDSNADGQCTGIGFGCSLTPADGAQFLGVVAAPFLGLAGLLGTVLLAVLRTRPSFARIPPSAQALAVLAILAVVAGVVAALTLG